MFFSFFFSRQVLSICLHPARGPILMFSLFLSVFPLFSLFLFPSPSPSFFPSLSLSSSLCPPPASKAPGSPRGELLHVSGASVAHVVPGFGGACQGTPLHHLALVSSGADVLNQPPPHPQRGATGPGAQPFCGRVPLANQPD